MGSYVKDGYIYWRMDKKHQGSSKLAPEVIESVLAKMKVYPDTDPTKYDAMQRELAEWWECGGSVQEYIHSYRISGRGAMRVMQQRMVPRTTGRPLTTADYRAMTDVRRANYARRLPLRTAVALLKLAARRTP